MGRIINQKGIGENGPMKIYQITDREFSKYGRIITGMEVPEIMTFMEEKSPCPDDVVYVASVAEMENCGDAAKVRDSLFGGLPVQIGYCNGHNKKLNALEYHRSSEINMMATDAVFMLGLEQDIEADGTYDTSKIELFHAPKGSIIEVYATTLHYAPCQASENGFRVVVALPAGTNLDLPEQVSGREEDKMLFAANKWLIGHKEGGLPEQAFIGLKGENLTLG